MLTADEYFTFTGTLAPEDFNACLALAERMVHGKTLYAYVGRDLEQMPGIIQTTFKQALALQTMTISQKGGVAGYAENDPNTVSLGKFSYSGGNTELSSANANDALSPAVRALLPLLISYGRGLRA